MNKPVDPVVSKYFSDMAKKRKGGKRGFSDPQVVKKAVAQRIKNNAAKKQLEANQTPHSKDGAQSIQNA